MRSIIRINLRMIILLVCFEIIQRGKGEIYMHQGYDLKYLQLLSKQYPTIDEVTTEVINLSAIINLPKGTEHFLTDIHGEHEAFDHVMRNASGVVKRKIGDTFGDLLTAEEKKSLATLVYYPKEKLDMIKSSDIEMKEWYRTTIYRLVLLSRAAGYKYTRSKVRKALPQSFAYIIEELLNEKENSENETNLLSIHHKQHY